MCVCLETFCLQGLDSGAITASASAMHAFIRSVGCPVEFLSGKRRWKSGHVDDFGFLIRAQGSGGPTFQVNRIRTWVSFAV